MAVLQLSIPNASGSGGGDAVGESSENGNENYDASSYSSNNNFNDDRQTTTPSPIRSYGSNNNNISTTPVMSNLGYDHFFQQHHQSANPTASAPNVSAAAAYNGVNSSNMNMNSNNLVLPLPLPSLGGLPFGGTANNNNMMQQQQQQQQPISIANNSMQQMPLSFMQMSSQVGVQQQLLSNYSANVIHHQQIHRNTAILMQQPVSGINKQPQQKKKGRTYQRRLSQEGDMINHRGLQNNHQLPKVSRIICL